MEGQVLFLLSLFRQNTAKHGICPGRPGHSNLIPSLHRGTRTSVLKHSLIFHFLSSGNCLSDGTNWGSGIFFILLEEYRQ